MPNPAFRITILSSVLNILLSSGKIITGLIFFSPALISDGLHSFSDLITDVMVFFSIKFAYKPKDEKHPYGHGKIENLMTLFIGLSLIIVAIFIFEKSIEVFIKHKRIEPSLTNILVAAISVCIKEFLYQISVITGKKYKMEILITNAWHHRSDALSSLAILIGLILYYLKPELYLIDPILSIIVSILIIKMGIEYSYASFHKIIDRTIDTSFADEITNFILKDKDVFSLHSLRGRYYGKDIIIDLHIQLDPEITLDKAHYITHRIADNVKNKFPEIKEINIHTEPAKNYNNKDCNNNVADV